VFAAHLAGLRETHRCRSTFIAVLDKARLDTASEQRRASNRGGPGQAVMTTSARTGERAPKHMAARMGAPLPAWHP
jgi:hypothetical protein